MSSNTLFYSLAFEFTNLRSLKFSKFLSILFSGTGYEVWGNCNAPRAVTLSALIYCLRSIVGRDVPLNQVRNIT